jgi:hypothetical protein
MIHHVGCGHLLRLKIVQLLHQLRVLIVGIPSRLHVKVDVSTISSQSTNLVGDTETCLSACTPKEVLHLQCFNCDEPQHWRTKYTLPRGLDEIVHPIVPLVHRAR